MSRDGNWNEIWNKEIVGCILKANVKLLILIILAGGKRADLFFYLFSYSAL